MYEIEKFNYNLNDLTNYLGYRTINIQKQLMDEYLNKLNILLFKNNYNYKYLIYDLINHIDMFYVEDRDDILFNLSGYLNHLNYFKSISPYQKNIIKGKIKDVIINKYGSYELFKKGFIKTALNLIGSGYTHLVINKNNELNIINTINEDIPNEYNLIPLITLDMWEHAYIIKYGLDKVTYINTFFEIIDFDSINNKYENVIHKK